MEVHFSQQFERAYEQLTAVEKRAVRKAVGNLGADPRYPGLRVKKVQGTRDIWEARASRSLRVTFEISGDIIFIRNVGEHDKVLKRP